MSPYRTIQRSERAGPLVALAAALWSCAASAQSALPQVDPGQIERDVERQRQRIEQQEQAPKQLGPAVTGPARPPAIVIPGGGPRFLLKSVEFDNSAFLSKEELAAIAAKYIGQQVDIAGLQTMVAEVNKLYVDRGIVTAIATLPPQTATAGAIKVALTEGKLQKTVIEGNKQTSTRYIEWIIHPPPGEVLDVPKLTNDVTWFNRTNDVQIKALLQPGADFGLTDLQLAAIEPARNTLQLFADNQGVQTTGRGQLGVYYKLHGLAGIDDRFTFYGIKSEGNLSGNVAYNMPFNPWGGRVGVSYTDGKIKVIRGPFESFNVTGKSDQVAVNVSQPFIANQNWLVQAIGAYAYCNSQTEFTGVAITNGRYQKATGGMSISAIGDNYSFTFAPAYNNVLWTDKIFGGVRNFDTTTGTLNGTVKFPLGFYAVGLGSYQYTYAKLVPGDQLFSIGGPTTVRGFPTNVVAGDSGYYYNAELHRNMSDVIKGLDLFVFIDGGSVYSTAPHRTILNSSGAGLSYTPVESLTLEASFGVPWRPVVPNQSHGEFYGRVSFRPLALLNVK